MKRNMLILTVALVVLGCSQSKQENYTLIGTWKSQDGIETMRVADESTLYRLFSGGAENPFEYKLSNDSIRLQFVGESFAAVPATKHKYSLSENTLIIDYSNYKGGVKTLYNRVK